MGSEGPPAFTVHVTGFKKFHGVSQDPTETVVSNLKEFIEKMGLPDGITLCSCTILETAGNGGLPKLVELTDSVLPQSFLDSASNEQIIWVHFGVNSGGTKFANESQAVNESTFRCPDEPCWQPQGGGGMSDDTDRFVCNYIYYQSLRIAEQKGQKALFVHIPLFSRITQMLFAASLLEALACVN